MEIINAMKDILVNRSHGEMITINEDKTWAGEPRVTATYESGYAEALVLSDYDHFAAEPRDDFKSLDLFVADDNAEFRREGGWNVINGKIQW